MAHGGGDTILAAEVVFAASVIGHMEAASHAYVHYDSHALGHGPQNGEYTNRSFRLVGGGTTGPNRPSPLVLPYHEGQAGVRVSCVMSLENFNPATMVFIDQLLARVNRRLFAIYKEDRWKLLGGKRVQRRFGLFLLTNAYVRGVNAAEPNQYFEHFPVLKSLNIASEKPEDYVSPRGATYKDAIGHTARGVFQFGLVELDDLGRPKMKANAIREGWIDSKGNPKRRPGENFPPVLMFDYDQNLPSGRVTMLMDTFGFAAMIPGEEGKAPVRMNVGGGEVNAFINCMPAAWYLNPETHRGGVPIQAMAEVNLASHVMAEEMFAMLHEHPLTRDELDRRRFFNEHFNDGKPSIRASIEPVPDRPHSTPPSAVPADDPYSRLMGPDARPDAGARTRYRTGV